MLLSRADKQRFPPSRRRHNSATTKPRKAMHIVSLPATRLNLTVFFFFVQALHSFPTVDIAPPGRQPINLLDESLWRLVSPSSFGLGMNFRFALLFLLIMIEFVTQVAPLPLLHE